MFNVTFTISRAQWVNCFDCMLQIINILPYILIKIFFLVFFWRKKLYLAWLWAIKGETTIIINIMIHTLKRYPLSLVVKSFSMTILRLQLYSHIFFYLILFNLILSSQFVEFLHIFFSWIAHSCIIFLN